MAITDSEAMAMVVYQGPQSHSVSTATSPERRTNEESSKFVGLTNQGATCYLNGLLQTLFMTPEFRKAIFTWNYDPAKDGSEQLCIPLQLQRLFGQLQLSKQRAVDTVALTRSFGWEGSEVFQQQDVQELTRVLFDALEETFRGTAVENIIDELYGGEMIDYIRCIDVDYQSERVDKFLDFSLAIVPFGREKAMRSLNECIEMFLRPEILNGDNKYYAEKFERKVDAIKGLKFGKLPHIMSVQLKRFVYDFSGAYVVQKKLNDQVKFPMILDMNKYVAKRKTFAADGEVIEERINEEFEDFLRYQMEKLNSAAQQEEEKVDAVEETKGKVGWADEDDDLYGVSAPAHRRHLPTLPRAMDVYDIAASKSGAAKHDAGTSTTVDGNDLLYGNVDAVEDPAVPALVDCEQDSASAQLVRNNSIGADEDSILYESLSDEEVEQMVKNRGEWIYELYAVLIHAGAISGGHYYAYIKDLDTKKWYNFNDSSVTPIDEKTVQEAWGGSIVTSTLSTSQYSSYYTSYYPRTTGSSYLSSANAYMLMYRKVSKACVSLASVGDEIVPQYIRTAVQEEEEKRLIKLREEEELRNRLNVKVQWNGTENIVFAKRTDTYEELLSKIWDQLELKKCFESKLTTHTSPSPDANSVITEETDVENNSVDGENDKVHLDFSKPQYSFFRLRDYNQYNKLLLSAYEFDKVRTKTLNDLAFNDYKSYVLETRQPDEEWEVYYVDGFSILVEEFDALSFTFKEARTVRLPKYSTVGDLKQILAKWVTYPMERIRVMKFISIGYNDGKCEILDQNDRRLREDLMIYEGAKVYFEDVGEEMATESLALAVFVNARNRIEIKHNNPPEVLCDTPMIVDGRWKVQDLRQHLAEKLGIPVEKCRMFKQVLKGQELKDGEYSLACNGVYNFINIVVTIGTAVPSGYYQVCFTKFTPVDNVVGVLTLPPLQDEQVNKAASMQDVDNSFDNVFDQTDAFAMDNSDMEVEADQDLDNISHEGLVAEDDQMLLDEDDTQNNAGSYAVAVAEESVAVLDVAPDEQVDVDDAAYRVAERVEEVASTKAALAEDLSATTSQDGNVSSECGLVSEVAKEIVKEIEPSDFGERMVRNVSSSNQFEAIDGLDMIHVQATTPIREVRLKVAEELVKLGKVPADFSAQRLRLRDRYGVNPGKILRDGKTFQEHQIYLCDNKPLSIQILDKEENLPEDDQGDVVVLVQRWHRRSWSLGQRSEVLLPGHVAVRDIAKGLGQLYDIPFDSLRVLVVPRETEFYLSELSQKSPSRNYGRSWFNPTLEWKLLRFMTHDLRVQDGDLLILQDCMEPLMELTLADLKSIEIVEAATRNPYSYSVLGDGYGTQTSLSSVLTNHVKYGPMQNKWYASSTQSAGIRIKTHKERMKEESAVSEVANPEQKTEGEGYMSYGDLTDATKSTELSDAIYADLLGSGQHQSWDDPPRLPSAQEHVGSAGAGSPISDDQKNLGPELGNWPAEIQEFYKQGGVSNFEDFA